MIELASGKRGLLLRGPLILAAGGYGAEYDRALLSQVHALVTLPTTLRPRTEERKIPRLTEFPGGALWNREGSNPGLASVLRSQRHAWRRLALPVILTLASEDVAHWGEMAARVGRIEAVSGLELELSEDANVAQAVAAVRAETDLPLLAVVPLERPLEKAQAAIDGGADILVVGLPPAGVEIGTMWWQGRLAGPGVKPLALRALYAVAAHFREIPLIGAGGIHSAADVRAFLDVGARAVQIDTAVWRNPRVIREIAQGLESTVP